MSYDAIQKNNAQHIENEEFWRQEAVTQDAIYEREKKSELEDLLVSLASILVADLRNANVPNEKDTKDYFDVPYACRICTDSGGAFSVFNCGHITCDTCTFNLHKCPFCNSAITGLKQVYL